MDGPPGTGKSQTITNVIAQLLGDGKTVLFVSEKAAALEVVQNRLAKLSLDPFVLALHSRTATRKAIAAELGKALNERPTAKLHFDSDAKSRLIRSRQKLTEYAIAVNAVRLPLDRSLHSVVGRLSQLDYLPAMPTPEIDALELRPSDLTEFRDLGDQLGRAWGPVARSDRFLWRNLRPDSSSSGRELRLRSKAEACRIALTQLESAALTIREDLRLADEVGPIDAPWLTELAELVERRLDVAPTWLSAEPGDEVSDRVQSLGREMADRQAVENRLGETGPLWVTIDPLASESLAQLERQFETLAIPVNTPDVVTLTGLQAFGAPLVSIRSELTAIQQQIEPLAASFGTTRPATLGEVDRLVSVGELVGSPTPPEAQWLNPVNQPSLHEARDSLLSHVTAYRAFRDSLAGVYSERILSLDLQALQVRFAEVNTGLKKFGHSFKEDKQTLTTASASGVFTQALVDHLPQALQWQQVARDLGAAEAHFGPFLGASYYPSHQSVDFGLLDRAIAVADLALSLAGPDIAPAYLASQLALGATPKPHLPQAVRSCQDLLGRLDTSFDELEKFVPLPDSDGLPIEGLIGWTDRCLSLVASLAGHLQAAEAAGVTNASLGATRHVLAERARYAEIDRRVGSLAAELSEFLGLLGLSPQPADLDRAVRWVDTVRSRFGGTVPARTAALILRTELTAAPIQLAMRAFEKSTTELIDEFEEPEATDYQAEFMASFGGAHELLADLVNSSSDVLEWESYLEARRSLVEHGLDSVVAECEALRVDADAVGDLIERSVLQRWADQTFDSDARLVPRRSVDRDTLHQEFRELDEALVADAASNVINRCSERRPKSLAGEAGIINQQALLKRKHMSTRTLLKKAGNAAQLLKPCFMMSPLTVSQFLPPDLHFDAVIFDEASQVREADAVCSIFRGDQLIVAGDPKQLPPTSFFQGDDGGDGGGSDDLEDDILDFESILDRCEAQGLPTLPLNWHYRSRHESLITFSNRSFYGGRLQTFPGATFEAPDLGVELIKVDGRYDRGGTRDNPIEAEAVVDRIVWHRQRHPDLTLGVVALSAAQQSCIEAAIERRRADQPELRDLVTDSRLDGFFVKNLENVQGDERDLIIISIGYGPDEYGKLTMQFGPLMKANGWRRLNVAVTRAKRRVEVVSSITPGQIVSDNASTRHLARYLDYADRGIVALAGDLTESVGEPDSPFEEEVIKSVTMLGYEAVPQVGVAGYRIDLGVRHPTLPGKFVLGVECDGATYHSSKVARDRDRLRQSVLEGLGWSIHRIWSTAWFSDRRGEEERLRVAIESAVRGDSPSKLRLVPQPEEAREVAVEEFHFDELPSWVEAFEEPRVSSPDTHSDFTDPSARSAVARQILEAVTLAGPIHEEDVLAALRVSWGLGRAGGRIRDAFQSAVNFLTTRDQIVSSGAFLSLPGQEIRIRAPRDDQVIPRKVAMVPLEERRLAVVKLLEDAGPTEPDRLRIAWARLFGWRRVGSDIEMAFEDDVDALTANGSVIGPAPLRLADFDR